MLGSAGGNLPPAVAWVWEPSRSRTHHSNCRRVCGAPLPSRRCSIVDWLFVSDNRPDVERSINDIGRSLQSKYGHDLIPTHVLDAELVPRIGTRIHVTDRCYNVLNPESSENEFFVFVREKNPGWFRYVGPYFPYTGPIT